MAKYAHPDPELRTPLGCNVGKKKLMAFEKQQVLVDVIRRADRGNTPKTFAEIIDTMQELEPISRKQARDVYDRTIKPANIKQVCGQTRQCHCT